MDTPSEILGKLLSPFFGTYVLIGLGLGVACGLLRKAISRFGIIKALVAAGGIVIAGCAVRYVPLPAQVQPQRVAVKKTPTRVQQKARPHRRRRYVQYPGF
jgi:hypothetical protein